MGAVKEEFLPTEKQEQTFEKLMGLIDIGEEMVDEIERSGIKNPKELTDIIEPLLLQLEESVGVVTKTFFDHAKAGETKDKKRSIAVDVAMKKVYDHLYILKDKGDEIMGRLNKEGSNGA